ncbi:uncharacterized protein BYT42DRAFT_168700 [Radiomyces spectabilis]|uniref:uncharacterized protein n=1 Tax=Radiomyces spectabilis TaxID=64574 RepID=UPI00221FD7C4|nr:uncharacterized protein BYT42DRAFT_168700 [Radiomyces spectabilis]KAI8364761.1 hypothetical protein BYT42DRAFT_168700 [Radiomyces spectabilis]
MITEDEYEEETVYLELDLGSSISAETVEAAVQSGEPCALIGIDSDTPYFQLGPYIFAGDFDETVGTHLLFEITEKQRDATGFLPLLSSMRSENTETTKTTRFTTTLQHAVNKVIKFQRVELTKKTQTTSSVRNEKETVADVETNDHILDDLQ